MREEITLRLRGSWERAVRPGTAELGAVLAPFGAELADVPVAEPGELELLIVMPETADLTAVGAAVADALALPSPRITFERENLVLRAAAGRGYYCACGGVDGDHLQGCPKAAT